MTPIERERYHATIEVCALVEALIYTQSVPDYMHDYMHSRVKAAWRAYGITEPDDAARGNGGLNGKAA